MPVSYDPRCIFIHVPRTGGTSMMSAFAQAKVAFDFAGTGLWELIERSERAQELIALFRQSFRLGGITGFRQQHLPAEVLRLLVPGDVWEQAFRFAIVRNPWDLVVSTYHFQRRYASTEEARRSNPDLFELMRRTEAFDDYVARFVLARGDMSALLCDREGRLLVEFVGRFEDLDEAVGIIAGRTGVHLSVPRLNATNHGDYRAYYTARTRRLVEGHFARDIERFGYAF